MTTYFKILAQVQSRADYDKILRTALSKPGPETFHYFDAFPFDKKEAPLLLVGDVGKPLLADLKKAAPKAAYATGTCSVNTKEEILIDRTAGKLQIKELTAGLRLSGIKNVVKLAGGDEDEGGEQQSTESTPPITATTAATTATTTATTTAAPKAGKPGVPTPQQLAKVNLKPVPQQGKPVAPQDPAAAKQWQDKVKILRPAYDLALKKAKAQTGGTWAEDLEGSFAQMLHEAKGGDFAAALATLGRLARMLKSEEAARAEAKHQTSKEDANFREATAQSQREVFGEQEDKGARRVAKSGGYGLTDDGHGSYARAYTAQDWKTGVVDALGSVKNLLKQQPPDLEGFQQAIEGANALVQRAKQHQAESDGRHPDRDKPLRAVDEGFDILLKEVSKLLVGKDFVKDPKALKAECDELRKAIEKHFVGSGQKPVISPQQQRKFKEESDKRRERYFDRKRKLEQELEDKRDELKKLDRLVLTGNLPEHHPQARKAAELRLAIQGLEKTNKATQHRDNFDDAESAMGELFERGVKDPQKVTEFYAQVRRTQDLIDGGVYDEAVEGVLDLASALGADLYEGETGEQLNMKSSMLINNLQFVRDAKSASAKAVAGLADEVKAKAEKLVALLP